MWHKLTACVTFVFFFGTSVAFPASETKDDLNGIVSSLLNEGQRNLVNKPPAVPGEVNEDTSEHDRKVDAYQTGNVPEGMAKRAPWYRDYYDGAKRFGGSFDSISHYSDFGKFQKRKKEESKSVSGNLLNRLKRGGFDSIHHFSDFGRFNKRSVDRAYFARGYANEPAWKRRAFDSIHHYSDFGRFNRRK